jgi:hypothetical protein
MSNTRLNTIILSASLFLGGGLLSMPTAAMGEEPSVSAIRIDSNTNQTIYTLQYAIIPGILFSENGPRFFNDLYTGNTKPFLDIVEGPLGKSYASGIKFTPIQKNGYDLVLLSFPEPRFQLLCVHAALIKQNGKYRYITLEEPEASGKNGTKAFMGEWTVDSQHKNYGPKKYDDTESFLNDVDKMLNQ